MKTIYRSPHSYWPKRETQTGQTWLPTPQGNRSITLQTRRYMSSQDTSLSARDLSTIPIFIIFNSSSSSSAPMRCWSGQADPAHQPPISSCSPPTPRTQAVDSSQLTFAIWVLAAPEGQTANARGVWGGAFDACTCFFPNIFCKSPTLFTCALTSRLLRQLLSTIRTFSQLLATSLNFSR